MYSTVSIQMTEEIRRKKLEHLVDEKRFDRIQYAPYSLDLAQFHFALFPQLKSDLHGKRFSDLVEPGTESDLKNMVL